MLPLILAFAATASWKSVAELRLDGVTNAWSTCAEHSAKKATADIRGISPSDAIEIAMKDCAEFERDYRSATYFYAPEFLRKQGTTSFGPDVVNMLAEEALKVTIADIADRTRAKLKVQ